MFGAGFPRFHQRRGDAFGNFALLLHGAPLKPGDLPVRHGSSSRSRVENYHSFNDGSPAGRVSHRRVLESSPDESCYTTDAGTATAGPDDGGAARSTARHAQTAAGKRRGGDPRTGGAGRRPRSAGTMPQGNDDTRTRRAAIGRA